MAVARHAISHLLNGTPKAELRQLSKCNQWLDHSHPRCLDAGSTAVSRTRRGGITKDFLETHNPYKRRGKLDHWRQSRMDIAGLGSRYNRNGLLNPGPLHRKPAHRTP